EYRNAVPLLHQTILSVLPNEKNNPEQAELYKAFANGDVEAVLQTDRKERKQIFVTSMSVYFVNDIATATLGDTDLAMRSGRREKGGARTGVPPGWMPGMPGMPDMPGMPGAGPRYSPETYYKKGKESDTAEEGPPDVQRIEKKAGFVVTIAGYSPYENIDELMVGVEDDQSKWGFITRLLHLETIVDGNIPFKLYKKSELEPCKLEKGVVDIGAEMPAGIRLVSTRTRQTYGGAEKSRAPAAAREQVLIDPMTKEIISKIAELD
ncbi:unnamed protein product, partial [marine sediment metagenome]